MENRIRNIFDCIHSEEVLKERTTDFLRLKMQKNSQHNRYIKMRRLALAFIVILITLGGGISYDIYFTPSVYIDIDVNPSIELEINKVDRVIGVYSYNDDGTEILKTLSLTNKSYKAAINDLVSHMEREGYLEADSLISLTVQTDNKGKEDIILSTLNTDIQFFLQARDTTAQTALFPVTEEVRAEAHNNHVSPAKYLAILDLQTVDSTATIESCKNHSISEIKQLTQAHGKGHHGSSDSEQYESQPTTTNDYTSDITTEATSATGCQSENVTQSVTQSEYTTNNNSMMHNGGRHNRRGHH